MSSSLSFPHAAAAAALVLVLSGCVSLSTFQSPRVLDPGTTQLGAGVIVTGGEAGTGEVAIVARRGLADGVDVGAKLWGIPPFLGLYADVRYQILREPFLVSGTLGGSVFSVREDGDDDRSVSTTALYPTVLVGTERLFGGVRWTQVFGSAGDLEENYGVGFPGIVVGASFGSRLILAPEVNVHFGEGGTLVLPGAALHFRF